MYQASPKEEGIPDMYSMSSQKMPGLLFLFHLGTVVCLCTFWNCPGFYPFKKNKKLFCCKVLGKIAVKSGWLLCGCGKVHAPEKFSGTSLG